MTLADYFLIRTAKFLGSLLAAHRTGLLVYLFTLASVTLHAAWLQVSCSAQQPSLITGKVWEQIRYLRPALSCRGEIALSGYAVINSTGGFWLSWSSGNRPRCLQRRESRWLLLHRQARDTTNADLSIIRPASNLLHNVQLQTNSKQTKLGLFGGGGVIY